MAKTKLTDILFWILILAALGIAIWLVFGSPTIETGLLMIVIFIASSEIMLWRTLFNIDKRTSIGFIKAKNDLNIIKKDLTDIKNLIKNAK